MTKHIDTLTSSFRCKGNGANLWENDTKCMVQRTQQNLKKKPSYIKAPVNLCDDRMKFIEDLITLLFYSRL